MKIDYTKIEIQLTCTKRSKLTVTKDGDVRIKINKDLSTDEIINIKNKLVIAAEQVLKNDIDSTYRGTYKEPYDCHNMVLYTNHKVPAKRQKIIVEF